MNWKTTIPILIVCIIFISGCTQITGNGTLDISSAAKQIPEIKAFLEEHPDADIVVVLWTSEYIKNNNDKIHEKCSPAIELDNSYYRAELNEKEEKIIAWITVDTREVVCIRREGQGTNQTENNIVETCVWAFDKAKAGEECKEYCGLWAFQTASKEYATFEECETGRNSFLNMDESTGSHISGSVVAETEEDEPEEETEFSQLSAKSSSYDKGYLVVDVYNKGKTLNIECNTATMNIQNSEEEYMCESGSLSSTNFKCINSCGEELVNNEVKKVLINIANCGPFKKGYTYSYEIEFINDAKVSGSFTV